MEMLTFTIDTDSRIPIYHQLYSFIKKEIRDGRIVPPTKLPSKRKLAQYLKLSQNTIQTAYEQLIEEGYVVPRERSGFYVSQIDNIVRLDARQEGGAIPDSKTAPPVEYDFSYHGVDNENFPFAIWRRITKEVINEYDPELLELGDSQGHPELRRCIADYLHQSRGVNCSPDQIVVSAGTEFLVQMLIQLFGREAVYGIENPGYERLNLVFAANQARFEAVKIDQEGMIPAEIRKSTANILCITPAHQFPSGEIMPINRRVQILNWANEVQGRYIIEDDYDSEFKYSGKPIPALQGLDSNEKVIYIGAFSKALSPGLRVSYMVLPLHLLKEYLEKLSFIICPVPAITQKVLYRFIRDGYFERHLNRMRNIYKKKRELLIAKIMGLNCGIEVAGADAGLHVLLKVNNQMTEEELKAAAQAAAVKVYGISKYYFQKKDAAGQPAILLGFATMSEVEIDKAVKTLKRAWFPQADIRK